MIYICSDFCASRIYTHTRDKNLINKMDEANYEKRLNPSQRKWVVGDTVVCCIQNNSCNKHGGELRKLFISNIE